MPKSIECEVQKSGTWERVGIMKLWEHESGTGAAPNAMSLFGHTSARPMEWLRILNT
jgi:hypothetical protein